jgi:hypothetical protein
MKTAIAWGLTLMLYATAEAAEPAPVQAPQTQTPPPATNAPHRDATTASKPMDLRIGDIRKYMTPNEYHAALNAADADKSTVIVEGARAVAPLQSERPQPVGLGAVYSLFRHPTSAWRLFVPDTSAYAPQPGPPDVVPPREFRWGP